jgi:hypothetical protein
MFYAHMARAAFASALRAMIEQRTLTEEQKQIASLVMEKARHIPEFFTTSHIVYLSNGIVDAQTPEQAQCAQEQLFLELCVRLLQFKLVENIRFTIPKEMFCLGLNMRVPPATALSRAGNGLIFHTTDGNYTLQKNEECAITEKVNFLVDDKNPYNIDNDHPDLKGQQFAAYDLGGVSREKWVSQFREAYALIKENVPVIYGEIYPFLDEIAPHGYVPGKQMSSTYSRSPGILYLSYTDKMVMQAEAIIHEVHHTIYNIISWKFPLLNNARELKYYSAYRRDARHLHGCFIGLHAFVAVQNFYCSLGKAGDTSAIEQFLVLYLKDSMVIAVLEKYADFTHEGRMLFDDVCANFHQDDAFFGECSSLYMKLKKDAEEKVREHFEAARRENAVLLH